jgi:thiol-disulfide isomerase/thioredoxin
MTRWIALGLILIAMMTAVIVRVRFNDVRTAPATPINNPLFQPLEVSQMKPMFAKHRITLVNMWASWCAPCKAEIPEIVELLKRHEKEGLGVILMSVDQPSDRGEANRFLEELKIDFPTYFAAEPIDDTIVAIAGDFASAIPASFLFNAAGERVDSWQGGAELSDFEAKILPLLAK